MPDGDADKAKHWLADGYHRWHAHKSLGLVEIDAEVRQGNALDALVASLRANAEHGKRREPGDYRRAYEVAVRHRLIAATDVDGLASLIRCSGSWAERLTRAARDAVKAERDAEARVEAERGEPVRETAARLGVSKDTVARAQRVAPADSPQMRHVAPSDDAPPHDARREAIRADLADMESPKAQRWHGALRALCEINEQAPVDLMFAERHRRVDHAIGPELQRAHAWINDLHRRFFDDRSERSCGRDR